MSESSKNLNAPRTQHWLYFAERTSFAGVLLGGILYGIVVILFFQCMDALLNPARRASGGIKWKLVVHTTAMFLCVTAFTVTNFTVLSTSYIDNRKFDGDDVLSPGPFGYQSSYSKSINVAQYIMFFLNNWLADGLLLYRCYVIYARSYWIIVVPCLMYLASSATGVTLVYQNAQPSGGVWTGDSTNFGYPYFLISLSLNILLTFMIVTRLAWHNRALRSAMGPLLRTNGLYDAVSAMLVESLALYTVNFILVIAAWGLKSYIAYTFFPALAETQVIAPLLIILRAANKRSATNDIIASVNVSSLRIRSQGKLTDTDETLPSGYTIRSTDADGQCPAERGTEAG